MRTQRNIPRREELSVELQGWRLRNQNKWDSLVLLGFGIERSQQLLQHEVELGSLHRRGHRIHSLLIVHNVGVVLHRPRHVEATAPNLIDELGLGLVHNTTEPVLQITDGDPLNLVVHGLIELVRDLTRRERCANAIGKSHAAFPSGVIRSSVSQ